MKEHLQQIVTKVPNKLSAKNLAREYCQARVLQFLQEQGLFRFWIFHGGTALRLLYMLPRYSEDLDFALLTPFAPGDLAEVVSGVLRSFEAEAYIVRSHKLKEDTPVKSVFITFPGLFHELGLSPHRTEALSIKIELDSQPPGCGTTETSIIRRHVILNVLHYDRASLLSGKLYAVLMRPYSKGRDLYDLYWYMSDPSWPEPNLRFLNEALRQTRWPGPELTPANWLQHIRKRLESIDWRKAVDDVRPLIERESDLVQLTRENVLKLLASRRQKLRKLNSGR